MRGFFLGFLGREVQSVLGFLKGKTSSFFLQSSLFDTVMSRQDIFSSCKSLISGYMCTFLLIK